MVAVQPIPVTGLELYNSQWMWVRLCSPHVQHSWYSGIPKKLGFPKNIKQYYFTLANGYLYCTVQLQETLIKKGKIDFQNYLRKAEMERKEKLCLILKNKKYGKIPYCIYIRLNMTAKSIASEINWDLPKRSAESKYSKSLYQMEIIKSVFISTLAISVSHLCII